MTEIVTVGEKDRKSQTAVDIPEVITEIKIKTKIKIIEKATKKGKLKQYNIEN